MLLKCENMLRMFDRARSYGSLNTKFDIHQNFRGKMKKIALDPPQSDLRFEGIKEAHNLVGSMTHGKLKIANLFNHLKFVYVFAKYYYDIDQIQIQKQRTSSKQKIDVYKIEYMPQNIYQQFLQFLKNRYLNLQNTIFNKERSENQSFQGKFYNKQKILRGRSKEFIFQYPNNFSYYYAFENLISNIDYYIYNEKDLNESFKDAILLNFFIIIYSSSKNEMKIIDCDKIKINKPHLFYLDC